MMFLQTLALLHNNTAVVTIFFTEPLYLKN